MDLIKARLRGFRRFHNVTVDLDEPVVAIVGPNEAGKSSLLDALVSLEHTEAFGSDITRGTHPPADHRVVELTYALNEEERTYADQLGGIGTPRFLVRHKRPDGQVNDVLSDPYRRDRRPRVEVRQKLSSMMESRPPSAPPDELAAPQDEDAEEADEHTPLTQQLDGLLIDLDTEDETLDNEVLGALDTARSTAEKLSEHAESKVADRWLAGLIECIGSLLEHERARHPQADLLEYLSARCPPLLKFEDEDRQLASEYGEQQLANPPAALGNLLALAEVDEAQLRQAMATGRHEDRYTIQDRANRRLRERFGSAWRQSDVTPELQIDEAAVRVQVSAPGGVFTPLAERSDGLRTFVAMYAYTFLHAFENPPVLLIDEAENHLHYDAQADLVRVFTEQKTAAQIIYTTHSAGCLPQDLGRGVRVVRPVLDDNGEDIGQSEVSNSFWTEGAGFSPLMLAMGASVLALVPTRRAVITEGAADFILLPTLFRQALDADHLHFQIAPGLAEVEPEKAAALSLEAPRVAYLLDGDKSGRAHAAKLRGAGVEDREILRLPDRYTPEDLVTEEAFLDAVNEELRRSHGTEVQIEAGSLTTPGRAVALAAWCDERGVDPPSKRKVADRLATVGRRTRILAADQKKPLVEIHQALSALLELQDPELS